MEHKIKNLKEDVVRIMKRKFGQITNIDDIETELVLHKFKQNKVDDLEECVMKKMIVKLRLQIDNTSHRYKAIVFELDVRF